MVGADVRCRLQWATSNGQWGVKTSRGGFLVAWPRLPVLPRVFNANLGVGKAIVAY